MHLLTELGLDLAAPPRGEPAAEDAVDLLEGLTLRLVEGEEGVHRASKAEDAEYDVGSYIGYMC